MALENILYSYTLEASGDLSANTGYVIQKDGDGRAALADATSDVMGILQNAPDALGVEAEVGMIGISIGVAGAAIAYGAKVTADSAGKLVATTADLDDYVGVAVTAAAADGDEFEVFLSPFSSLSA